MKNLIFIGIGGFFGAIMRYLVGGWAQRLFPNTIFPAGTMIVNVTGCLLIGFGFGLLDTRQFFTPELRMFVFVGFLGSFTTFSTFGYETFALIRDGQTTLSILNAALSLALGLTAVIAGHAASRLL